MKVIGATTKGLRGGGASYYDEVTSDSPSAYWRLGESSGTTAFDEIGAYDGTYIGSPTLGVTGAVAGNTAVALDGTQYASESTLSAFSFIQNTAVFTVEFWIKITSPATRQALMGNTVTGANRGFFVIFENGVGFGTKAIRISLTRGVSGTANGVVGFRTADNSINDSDWHHVAIVHTSAATSSAEIYVDGVSQSITYSRTFTSLSSGDSADPLFIGSANHSGTPLLAMNGSIDEVAIYPTALSATRILAHYNAGI